MSDRSTAAQVRRTFLEHFRSHGHEVVPSGPLVLHNDPTLIFANAGMVQFKDVFTGREKRAYSRATSSQKCLRIRGKHNDLENVGQTARHHTFFEMLGNFSFGDYFKEKAIVLAWELIQKYGIPKDRLVFTYFKGEEGIPADHEARDLWKKVTGCGDDRVIGLGKSDNFWSMGDTGACGPCTEIHYRHGAGAADPATFGEEPAADGKGWMEIWNLVFMQFERLADGSLKPLPAPSVDTGMGLERITSVVQGVTSNYDTDLLRELVESAARLAHKKYGGSMAEDDVSMRVIADHARTTAFLIAEGVFPDRSEKEYVLRRVMRRAIRHGHRLGIEKLFFHEVATQVVDLMGEAYPELVARRETIRSVSEQEEDRFRRTIERGLKILDEDLRALGTGRSLSGESAFKLYDTYGFPFDLTEVICRERGYTADEKAFKEEQEAARGNGTLVKPDTWIDNVYLDLNNRILAKTIAPELASEAPRFVGYETESIESVIVALIEDGRLVERAEPGKHVEIVTRETPFYAESGGQSADVGVITLAGASASAPSVRFVVSDVQKPAGGLIVHRGLLEGGPLSVGTRVALEVDHERRGATRRNHSATHLLHFALRHVLGEHVQQKGSLVGPERLRFDYAHGKTLTAEQVTRIEDVVNEMVLANAEVVTQVLPIAEARSSGAMAIFEEKYGETVRVLTMDAGRYKSVELCGGTHARRTGDIGLFRIGSDRGVSAGVRRIEATTGFNTLKEMRTKEHALEVVFNSLHTDLPGLGERVSKLLENERALEKRITELERKLALGGGSGEAGGIDAIVARAKVLQGVKVLAIRSEISEASGLRELADSLRDKLGEAIVLVGAVQGNKAALVLTVSKPLTSRFKAGELIKPIAAMVGGSGGGRPDMAQAGGTQLAKLDEAIAELYRQLA